MYRAAASQSVLTGTVSGPYTGGTKVIDAGLLDPAVRARLDEAISGRGHPNPIASDRPAVGPLRATWGIILAVALLCCLFAVGFANLDSDWAIQPVWASVLYLGLGLLFAVCLLPIVRRRVLYGGGTAGALRPGRYLFPLDAIAIAMPDATGRQAIEVRPLGDARSARIEAEGKTSTLVIAFEGGDAIRFPVRGDAGGEVALRRLAHAQRLLEDLTYAKGLEQSFANDVFFDLRVDATWDRFGLAKGEATEASTSTRRRDAMFAAALALGLGGGTFLARWALGDLALYDRAQAYGTVEAYDRYLARGGRQQLAALDRRQRLLDIKKERERKERSPEEDQEVGAVGRIDQRLVDDRCIQRLEERASPLHPIMVKSLAEMVRQGTRRRDHILNFDFERHVDGPSDELLLRELDRREDLLIAAVGQALGDICPASVLRLGRKEGGSSILFVTYTVEVAQRPWPTAMAFHFRMRFVDRGHDADSFTLDLDPPAAPPTGTRDKSLFALPSTATASARLRGAQTARAFDRLYDEVWSFVFDGDPRVPWGHEDE